MNELITSINDAIWGYVLIFVLVGCGIWFTIKTRFVQFRMVDDYRRQKRQGIKEPVFHRSQIPELEDKLECWE